MDDSFVAVGDSLLHDLFSKLQQLEPQAFIMRRRILWGPVFEKPTAAKSYAITARAVVPIPC